jgi:hypothetical protein
MHAIRFPRQLALAAAARGFAAAKRPRHLAGRRKPPEKTLPVIFRPQGETSRAAAASVHRFVNTRTGATRRSECVNRTSELQTARFDCRGGWQCGRSSFLTLGNLLR